jgi:hypothetical protein
VDAQASKRKKRSANRVDPDGRQTADGSTLDDNVVRLPRDWLGPRDELIPIGSSANEQSRRADEGLELPPTANDFWGEESSSLQTALEAPLPRMGLPGAHRTLPRYARQVSAVVAGVAVLVAVAVFATGGRSPNVGAARSSGTSGSAPYLAMAARMSHALESAASSQKRAVTNRARHAGSAVAGRRSGHQTRRTMIVERVRYVTAQATSSGVASRSSGAPATPTPQTSSESSSPDTGSGNQPAVGANGALGPGTSPDG